MNKKICLLLLMFFQSIIFSQVGIGTTRPRGALDINKGETNTMGLVLPTNADAENIINPMGGSVAVGTIIYDSGLNCVRVYKPAGWSKCLSESEFTLDCASGTLTGTYSLGKPSSGRKVIRYTGGNGGSYKTIEISSTGVTGLTAKAPAGKFSNGSGSITLNISGTPKGKGEANFRVNLEKKSCTFSVAVSEINPTVASLNCNDTPTKGRYISYLPSTGNKLIHYTGGNGQPYGAIEIASTGVNGLTASAPAGKLSNGNGSITLNINGSPSSEGEARFLINLGGSSCSFSASVSAPSDKCTKETEWGVNISKDKNNPTKLIIGEETVEVYRITEGKKPDTPASRAGYGGKHATKGGVELLNPEAYFRLGPTAKHVTSMTLVFSKPVNNIGLKSNWYRCGKTAKTGDSSALTAYNKDGNPILMEMNNITGDYSYLSLVKSGRQLIAAGRPNMSCGNNGAISYIATGSEPYTRLTLTTTTNVDDILASFTTCNASVYPDK
ncbi:MAG: hypothetical protein FDW93_06355 [Bergeyella sp.]|nr:hypothetical protein [Bergeyella sp.]